MKWVCGLLFTHPTQSHSLWCDECSHTPTNTGTVPLTDTRPIDRHTHSDEHSLTNTRTFPLTCPDRDTRYDEYPHTPTNCHTFPLTNLHFLSTGTHTFRYVLRHSDEHTLGYVGVPETVLPSLEGRESCRLSVHPWTGCTT